MKRICVFRGSNRGLRPDYRAAAVEVGVQLARHGIGLVYGGGNVGLMADAADAVLAAGGHVTGVIPHALAGRELAHNGLSDLRVVASMHERKALMAEFSDAFLALPGGYGMLEEFCEVLTWSQLIHRKPCGLLNVAGYYDPLLAMFDHAVAEGFVPLKNRALVLSDIDPAALIDRLLAYELPLIRK